MSNSASGTVIGYAVEARYDYPEPYRLTDTFSLTKEWRGVSFPASANGVPMAGWPREPLVMMGLYSYEQAETLRWSLVARASAEHKVCLDTRLVAYKVKYSVTSERDAAYEHKSVFRGPAGLVKCEDQT